VSSAGAAGGQSVISVSVVTMQLVTTIRSPMRSSLAEYARMRLTPERASSVNFMPLKYPLVHECVIVIADLFLPEGGSTDAAAVPGLERIARFGHGVVLDAGWRPWLARRVGCHELAGAPAACVAALAADPGDEDSVWLATAVHWLTGLTSLHWDSRGLLRLPPATLQALAADFRKVFQGSGFRLEPLESGGFLVTGPPVADTHTIEPARCIGASIATALPAAPSLRQLGAELEIWLHEHPINLARIERGELPISSLWMWGGGNVMRAPSAGAIPKATSAERFYGSDPYLDGLCCARGTRAHALPERIKDLLESPAQRIVIVVELAGLLQADRAMSVPDALATLDARWIRPAAALVAGGALRSVYVVANDRCLSLTRHDRLKRWRRARRGLAGLQ
jgi:hypothetical protein